MLNFSLKQQQQKKLTYFFSMLKKQFQLWNNGNLVRWHETLFVTQGNNNVASSKP